MNKGERELGKYKQGNLKDLDVSSSDNYCKVLVKAIWLAKSLRQLNIAQSRNLQKIQLFNDLQYIQKKRIQERTNITKIVKITYYNRINDDLVKLCPV